MGTLAERGYVFDILIPFLGITQFSWFVSFIRKAWALRAVPLFTGSIFRCKVCFVAVDIIVNLFYFLMFAFRQMYWSWRFTHFRNESYNNFRPIWSCLLRRTMTMNFLRNSTAILILAWARYACPFPFVVWYNQIFKFHALFSSLVENR